MRKLRRLIAYLIALGLLFETESASQSRGNPSEKSIGRATSKESLIADMGFRPNADGFHFENYGNESGVVNLTPREMWRLFGPAAFVEASQTILTPPARRWMMKTNDEMKYGHSEGMAVLPLVFFIQRLNTEDYGAKSVPELRLAENPVLQREIALWYATQSTQPANRAEIKNKTPREIVDLLASSFRTVNMTSHPLYTLGIRKRNGEGGHSMTPYAIREVDDVTVEILSYDNNHPNSVRAVKVNRAANTWEYRGGSRPGIKSEHYEGDASTFSLTIAPSPPRAVLQSSPFIGSTRMFRGLNSPPDPPTRGASAEAKLLEIFLGGAGDLLIADESGRRIGFLDGEFVNEIPGAEIDRIRGAHLLAGGVEPRYYLPAGPAYTIAIDGTRLIRESLSDLTILGEGYELVVEGIRLDPGQTDKIVMKPDGSGMKYIAGGNESPTLILGYASGAADYEVEIGSFDLNSGATVEVGYEDNGAVRFFAANSSEPASLILSFTCFAMEGVARFANDDVVLNPGDTGRLHFATWAIDGAAAAYRVEDASGNVADRILQDEF